MTKRVQIEVNSQGEYVIALPDEVMEHLNLEEGDVLDWYITKDDRVVLSF